MSQTSTAILDGFVRHQIFLQRLGGQYVNELLPLIIQLNKEVKALLSQDLTDYELFSLTQRGGELSQIIYAATGELDEELVAKLEELAEYEAGFTARLLDSATTFQFAIPSTERLISLVSNTTMELISGKNKDVLTVNQMVSKFARGYEDKVTNTVRAGILAGQSTAETSRQVAEITSRSVSDAEAIVRTATNHVGAMARKEVYAANTDAIAREEWVSVLDHRTTVTCAALDGLYFQVGDGVYPPRHYRCRSLRIPITNSRYNKQIKGLSGQENKRNLNAIFNRRSAEIQEAILGPERYQLFKDGKYKIDQFTDDTGVVYTLEELERMDSLAG